MDSAHQPRCDEPGGRSSMDGGKLIRLLTLCFMVAVALACTGQPFKFKSGSSGKKKHDRPKSALVEAVQTAPRAEEPVARRRHREQER